MSFSDRFNELLHAFVLQPFRHLRENDPISLDSAHLVSLIDAFFDP